LVRVFEIDQLREYVSVSYQQLLGQLSQVHRYLRARRFHHIAAITHQQLKLSVTEVAIAQVNSYRCSIGNGQAVPMIT
jgi:hypothetical protein